MTEFSNAQKLSAVLSRFAQPLITQLGGARLSSIPGVAALESRVRSTGWVSGAWTLAGEIAPYAEVIISAAAAPLISSLLGGVSDEALPGIAHGIVDKALEDGRLELLEGRVVLDKDDLGELKRLLNANLPCAEKYEVKEN